MVDGLGDDDKYRMVEDEFSTIAAQFTGHLHAAEYQRLRRKTKIQNAAAIQNISRPVVGSLTATARKRLEMLKHREKQRRGLRKAASNNAGKEQALGDSGDEVADVPWAGTSLHGLMESSDKVAMPLTTLTSIPTGTRASAGFHCKSGPPQQSIPTTLRAISQPMVALPRHGKGSPARRRVLLDDVSTESDEESGMIPLVHTGTRTGPNPSGWDTSQHSLVRPVSMTTRPVVSDNSDRPRPHRQPPGQPEPLTEPRREGPRNTATMSRHEKKSVDGQVDEDDDDDDNDDDDDDIFGRWKKKNQRQNARPLRKLTQPEKLIKKPRQDSRDVIPSFM